MRWKWIAFVGVALIVALAATSYLIISNYDYNNLKPRIARIVKEATGRELTIGGEVGLDFGFSPALEVTDVALANAPWASEPQMITVRRIEAKVRLLPLLFGDIELRYLKLAGVDVWLATDADGKDNWEFSRPAGSPLRDSSLNRLNIAVEDLRIENLNVNYHDEKASRTSRFNLVVLEMGRQAGPEFLAFKLQADYNGQPVDLSGRIGRLQQILTGDRFPLELAGQFSNANINIDGSIEKVRALQGIDLNVHIAGKNLHELGRGIGKELPQTEAFDLSGHLTGSGQSPMLDNISGNSSAGGAELAVNGRIGNLLSISDLNLQLKVSGKNLAQVEKIVGRKLPSTDEFELQGLLTGSTEKLTLQDARGEAHRGSLSLTVEGTIEDLITFHGLDLGLKAGGKDLAQAESIIGQKLPSTDEFKLEVHLTGSDTLLALKDIQGEARRGSLKLTAEGVIGNLTTFKQLNLLLKATGKDLAQAESIIGQKLPSTDEFELRGRLTGSTEKLTLQDARGEAHRGSLILTAEGTIGDLLGFKHLDLRLKSTGKNLAQADSIIGQKLPSTDDFLLEGRLRGSSKALSLHDIRARARRGSLKLTAEGSVVNLLAFERANLQLSVIGEDLAQAESIIGQKLPSTDDFTLRGRLAGSARALSVQNLEGRAQRGSLSLALTGAIKNLSALEGMDLKLKAGGKELAEIGPLVGTTLPELGPFDFSGHLSGSASYFSLDNLTVVIDQSDFNGLAKVKVRKRPKITLVLESSLLDMTALLKNLENMEKEPGRQPGAPETMLFSNDPFPFDVLKQVDADVSMKAKNVRARDANFEFGSLVLTLENGDLNVDDFQATYKQTRISGNFHLYPDSTPRVTAKFLVQDFDLGGLLRELRISEEVRSHLDIAVDVNSRGGSLHELMAALNGSVGAVMGEGYLTRYLDLLSVGLSRKVVQFWGKHKKGGEIRCAVVQFDVKNGIATSRAFVFDTEAGVLTGEGDINLETKQVNFLLVPEPRHISLNFWTKLRVSGPMMDPRVRPDTVSLLTKGAKALSALVIGPLGLLAPFVSLGAHKAHPCNIHGIGK